MPSPLATHWTLDPEVTFLNHGSFGACPRAVLARQSELRARLERQPVRFFVRDLEPLLDEARSALGLFLGAAPDDLAFVPNATTAVNAVVRSLQFAPGDELLATNHGYNACNNVLAEAAARSGARVVFATVPFPLANPEEVTSAILAQVTPRTRLALIDHITSPTGLVFPIESIVRALDARGVDTLVDGAHAPGMVPLSLDSLGAAYYTGNCHKWLCAPKGAGFLHVRRDRRDQIRPAVISHGANSPRPNHDGRSRFLVEFDWTGTADPTAYLCVPESLRFMESLLPGGWPEIMAQNHALALRARDLLTKALGINPPAPDSMIGSLASVPIPDGNGEPPKSPLYTDPLQDALLERFNIEVPVIPWPGPPKRLLRISAQLHNAIEDYERLVRGLAEMGVVAELRGGLGSL